uniref:Uncharacterized protein n=1 Tax=Glossina pallidipes TaxID=7398 RepID=A0A1B0A7X6_GLOPL
MAFKVSLKEYMTFANVIEYDTLSKWFLWYFIIMVLKSSKGFAYYIPLPCIGTKKTSPTLAGEVVNSSCSKTPKHQYPGSINININGLTYILLIHRPGTVWYHMHNSKHMQGQRH